MAKKKYKTYYFRTISDLHVIPLEKIEAFAIDLKLWLQALRITELTGKQVLLVTTPTDVFGWKDDGRHDVTVSITARSEPAKEADAVDPIAGVTTE